MNTLCRWRATALAITLAAASAMATAQQSAPPDSIAPTASTPTAPAPTASAPAPTAPAPAASAAQAVTLESVSVTGSHIRRIDLETQHPLRVLERKDLLRTGLTDVAEVAQKLVANGPTWNRTINNGGDGRELINLRNLGPNRTLVLVNGQRWVSALDGAVDLSAIPMAMVERVEVLKDGASAIYGSDAIAGVINIITRENFTGAELGTSYGVTDHGDGRRRNVEFSVGHSGKRWNASVGFSYANDDPIMAGDRAISSVPYVGLPLGATGAALLVFRYRGPWTLIPGRPGNVVGDYRRLNAATDGSINVTLYNYLETPIERKAIFAQGHVDVTSQVKLSAALLFNRRQSAQQLAPPRLAFGSFCCAGAANGFDDSADSVYNPFGVPLTAFGRRLLEAGPRRAEQTADTVRLHVGLDGWFDVGERSIEWGFDLAHTRTRQRETISPYQDNAKLALALGPSFFDAEGVAQCGTPAVPIALCVPLNVLGAEGSVTQAMLDYVNVVASNRQQSESWDSHLHATTTLVDLPAGPINVAAGLEYRRESGRDDPDALLAEGRANGGGINYRPTEGSYAVREAYAEFDVPLLADHRFARELDLDVATRWSAYARFGRTTNSQFSLRWKPSDDLLWRANFSQGFRAPSVLDLFQGGISIGAGFQDPCAADSHPNATTLARCAALGVPLDVPDYGGSRVLFGGNPALRPETALTRTLGFVYEPAWLRDLSVSLDWYRIELRDAIGERTSQGILDGCYQYNDQPACALVTRDPGTGEVTHINASMQNTPGGLETEGYDFTLHWQRDTPLGRFELRWDSAYINYYGELGQPQAGTILPDGSSAQGNVAGRNGRPNDYYGVVWRLRSSAGLAWHKGAWGASIDARYFAPFTETCEVVADVAYIVDDPSLLARCTYPEHMHDGQPDPLNRVGAATYVDLQVSWTAPWHAQFSLGARNAFDRQPPVSYTSYANSFHPDYDIPGRFLYASYRQKF